MSPRIADMDSEDDHIFHDMIINFDGQGEKADPMEQTEPMKQAEPEGSQLQVPPAATPAINIPEIHKELKGLASQLGGKQIKVACVH